MKSTLPILSFSLIAVIVDTVFTSQVAMPAPDLEPLCQKPYQGPQNNNIRSIFGITKCEVRAYPSLGGIVLGSFTAAELSWLGLSRSQPAYRSQAPQTEDNFAFQMLRLGARWWKSRSFRDHRSSQVRGGYPWPDSYTPVLDVGYPSTGGV